MATTKSRSFSTSTKLSNRTDEELFQEEFRSLMLAAFTIWLAMRSSLGRLSTEPLERIFRDIFYTFYWDVITDVVDVDPQAAINGGFRDPEIKVDSDGNPVPIRDVFPISEVRRLENQFDLYSGRQTIGLNRLLVRAPNNATDQ